MNSKHLTEGSRMPHHDKGKLRFYSNRFCPYAQRVQLVLDAKNVPYETININVSNKPVWFYHKNPLGKIPAIEVESGEVLYESLILSEYLDEKYHQYPLHSKDPLQKAKDKLLIDQFNRVISILCKMLLHSTTRTYMDDYHKIIMDGLNTFEREIVSRKGPYFGGNKPGMLDFMIWPWCERADLLKIFGNQFILRKDKYRNLMEWRKLMMENPVVKKSLVDAEDHMKFIQSYRAGFPDYDLLSK